MCFYIMYVCHEKGLLWNVWGAVKVKIAASKCSFYRLKPIVVNQQ